MFPYVTKWVTVALYVFATDFAYIVRPVRTNTFEASAREREPGGWNAKGISGDAETSIDSPMSTIFRRVLRRVTPMTLFVHTTATVRTKFPLWKSTFVRQVQPGARSFVHVCQRGAHRALPIARPDSSRDVVNMLIYWRRVRFEYTQVAKGYVWFLRNSFRWMTGVFVDISVNCCRRILISPFRLKGGRITSPNTDTKLQIL